MSEEISKQTEDLRNRWSTESRWTGIRRDYSPEEVVRLRPSIRVEHTLARVGAERLWSLLHEEESLCSMGALTGSQAVQMVRAGLKAIYISGWQVAADGNLASQTYPDQSLYPSDSVPSLVKRINNALLRADLIEASDDNRGRDWYAPIVADAEAGFGGPIHAYEIMRSMIEAGVSCVHFEDQLASEKKCGHMGGKVLVPTFQFIRTLKGARLASDVIDIPTILIARTDALDATLITSDVDEVDREFITGERTSEGYFRITESLDSAIARCLAYAPYVDLLWYESKTPDLDDAKRFADAIHNKYPGKLLAYNCSPSFNWQQNLDPNAIANFQTDVGKMGYKFQFVTLAGWHLLNLNAFDLARSYREEGMTAYVRLQQEEFKREKDGYTAVKHQREAGAEYFDRLLAVILGERSSTSAVDGSTEKEQFK